ncbi:hypothetical protein [uncultured Caulobacter sp.]|jgi:hypothetical protein|uniref:hypothetical protein n=1 Tax=uncultured Caulobacter sp. TaxID=158749 RepID=UPI00261051D1|nr:hypothetical protein [uncultured Caulobacter sp.]
MTAAEIAIITAAIAQFVAAIAAVIEALRMRAWEGCRSDRAVKAGSCEKGFAGTGC